MPTTTAAPPSCKLLSGIEPLLVQGLLFVISAAVLLARKQCDAARRNWLEFGLDGSKQVLGAGWVHCLNLVAAIVSSTVPSEGEGGEEERRPGRRGPCELYFINVLLDATIGVAIEAILLRGIVACIAHERLESGEYYDADGSFRLSAFAWQLVLWLLVVTAMKACITLILAADLDSWEAFAEGVLAPVGDDPNLELFVVMIVAPGLLNTLQFLCTDAFLRKQRPPSRREAVE